MVIYMALEIQKDTKKDMKDGRKARRKRVGRRQQIDSVMYPLGLFSTVIPLQQSLNGGYLSRVVARYCHLSQRQRCSVQRMRHIDTWFACKRKGISEF